MKALSISKTTRPEIAFKSFSDWSKWIKRQNDKIRAKYTTERVQRTKF